MTPATDPDLRQDVVLDLVVDTPLHIGGPRADGVVDLPLAADGQGRLMVPGSSWAGVLRAAAGRAGLDVEAVFGTRRVRADAPDAHAARLTVADTVLVTGTGAELRTGVGIDRRTGAAAHGLLYDRMVLPAGTGLGLELRYEGPRTEEVTRLVALVRARGLRLGGGSSRGLGRLRCTGARTRHTDLTDRSALLARIAGTTPESEIDPAQDAAELARIEVTWRPRRPVLVGSPAPAVGADLVPLTIATPDGLVPVLPGSSVKGVLRSLAERVLRTMLDLGPPDPDPVVAADDLCARSPTFELLFGSRGRAGALSVPDVVATPQPPGHPIEPDQWRRHLAGEPNAASWPTPRTHVALDRWTGGAAEHRLYTVAEPEAMTWAPLRLELDAARLDGDGRRSRAAVVLLGVTVGLLRDGLTGFGHGTTRGLGDIEVTEIRAIGAEQWRVTAPAPGADWWDWLSDIDGGLLEELVTA